MSEFDLTSGRRDQFQAPGGKLQDAAAAVATTVGSAANLATNGFGAFTGVKQRVSDFLSDTGFGKALRTMNLLPGANPAAKIPMAGNWGTSTEYDWRVKLSVPSTMASSPLLAPLSETGGMVFPYTPSLAMQHDASYQQVTPVHSNYPYFAYQNSDPKAMVISGHFLIENALEGEYWIAVVHYLRSITKMAYGVTSNQGSPPPLVKLTGYGDYVLPDVPVVVTNFTVTLEPDVDYMKVPIGKQGSWVPISSIISVTCQPIYSRRKVARFSLDNFVNGSSLYDGDGFI